MISALRSLTTTVSRLVASPRADGTCSAANALFPSPGTWLIVALGWRLALSGCAFSWLACW